MQTGAQPANAQLARRLGFWSTISLVIGVTIGSGIFRTPAVIAARVPDPSLMLAVWVLGGLISLCGALSVSELTAALPQTGGWYVFLREGWGRLTAFLYGWAELMLIRASATGAISMVFSEYFLRSLGWDPALFPRATHCVAAGFIILTAIVNIRGVRLGAMVVRLSSGAKVAALACLILLSFAMGGRAGASTTNLTASGGAVNAGLFGLALISVLWAYDGFADATIVAGEVTNPGRTLPLAIIVGTLLIVTIYLAANAAYLYVIPIDEVARSPLVAADAMRAMFGRIGVAFVSVAVAISAGGALMSTMLVSPRVFFAMANDGLFFRRLASVHPRYGTPHVAIALAAALGVVFVLTRTFEQLADTFVLSMWPFYGVAIAGLYKLRRTRPDLPRPYRVPGYPVVPAVFIAAIIYLVGNALVSDPLWTSMTFAILLAGVPVYYLAFRTTKNTKFA